MSVTVERSLNRLRSGAITSLVVFLTIGLAGCEYSKNIQEFPEPWQTLDPGKPLEKFPRIEILEQGVGVSIEPGDLIQLRIKDWSPRQNDWREMGDWWIWTGFQSSKETAFFCVESDVARILVNLRQGTLLRFLEGKEVTKATPKGPVIDRSGQLQLRPNPFGDAEYYSWRKNTHDFQPISEVSASGYFSAVEIKRVCKGPLQYRTVRLFDDGPVRVETGGLRSYTSHEPRETWIDEAKIEAICQDGRKVTFQYGPVGSGSGRKSRTPVVGYFDQWFIDAWNKIPRGVQFAGNRPPVVPQPLDVSTFTTRPDTAVKINILKRVSDPDGDRLTIRFLGAPLNGTLVPNADGSYTYTPKPGWAGREELAYKANDGLVESEGVARVYIHIENHKP